MTGLYELHARPELDSPALIVCLEGWIDAGLGAAGALEHLLGELAPTTVAEFDCDLLLDHRARRPAMQLDDGVVTDLRWPDISLQAGADHAGNDVLLLTGVEPDHNWRAFAAATADLALTFGTRLVVGLGAYPAPVPHTRPTGVVATASTRSLADQVGFVPGRIDVPAGVAAAVERHAAEMGVPTVGLWAQVPHYAAAMPYPAASAALLERLARVATLSLGDHDLDARAASTHDRLDELIGGNAEHEAMVAQLEAQYDATEEGGFLISGDELAAEVERFLRDEDR